MGSWQNGVWCCSLSWRRNLRDRELSWLALLMYTIEQCVLSERVNDRLVWKENVCEGYTVRSAYSIIRGALNAQQIQVFEHMWKTFAPSTVKTFMWRLFWGRIQTKQNLAKRGIPLSSSDLNCPFCDEEVESIDHLLFACKRTSVVWCSCLKWLGYQSALPFECRANFLQFVHGHWNFKRRCVWWRERWYGKF